jgi:hypothetical protein
LRLNLGFQFALYAAFSVLFVTGALWLFADQMKVAVGTSETWQAMAANLLMVHGGAAMITLMFLGALVPPAHTLGLAQPAQSRHRNSHGIFQRCACCDRIRALLHGIGGVSTVDEHHSHRLRVVPAVPLSRPRLRWQTHCLRVSRSYQSLDLPM